MYKWHDCKSDAPQEKRGITYCTKHSCKTCKINANCNRSLYEIYSATVTILLTGIYTYHIHNDGGPFAIR